MNKAEQFFYEYAGYSYGHNGETPEQGRTRGAKRLAEAEAWAMDNCVGFEWYLSEFTNEEFSDDKPYYRLWDCIARSGDRLTSLGGIDFGRDCEPWGDPYLRVVEAELALELMGEQQ